MSSHSSSQPEVCDKVVLTRVQRWLNEVIVGQGFCPFAKAPRDNNSIKYAIQQEDNQDTLFKHLLKECDSLLQDDKCETSLLIYTHALQSFDAYLDFLETANNLLFEAKLEGILQLASFHPDYVFADAPKQCSSHYTNRAPYPIIHILREDSITEALVNVASPEAIPERNIEHAKQLGADFFKQYL